MGARVGLAGDVEVGSYELQLKTSIDLLCHEMKNVREALARRSETAPIAADFQASGVGPASGILMLDLGGPAQGYVWELRRASFFEGDLPLTTPASGRGWVFSGTWMGYTASGTAGALAAQINGMQYIDDTQTLTFPVSRFYAGAASAIKYPEHYIALISPNTTGLLYAVSGSAAQYPDPSAHISIDF